jgi:hypothetical protein
MLINLASNPTSATQSRRPARTALRAHPPRAAAACLALAHPVSAHAPRLGSRSRSTGRVSGIGARGRVPAAASRRPGTPADTAHPPQASTTATADLRVARQRCPTVHPRRPTDTGAWRVPRAVPLPQPVKAFTPARIRRPGRVGPARPHYARNPNRDATISLRHHTRTPACFARIATTGRHPSSTESNQLHTYSDVDRPSFRRHEVCRGMAPWSANNIPQPVANGAARPGATVVSAIRGVDALATSG